MAEFISRANYGPKYGDFEMDNKKQERKTDEHNVNGGFGGLRLRGFHGECR